MPDSFPPLTWGPAPFDERDLDALLSGEMLDTPVALRQVADALTALRAGPTPAELTGEATILAEFRAVAEFRALGLGETARADGVAHTLEFPPLQPDRARGRAARHRGRRPARSFSRRGGVLMGAAAAALIVVAVAATGNLPGPLRVHTDSSSAAQTTSPSSAGSGSQGVQGKKANRESASPTAPASSAIPQNSVAYQQLCRAYFGYFSHSGPHSKMSAESALTQLIRVAGSPDRVLQSCKLYVKDMFPGGMPAILPYLPGSHNFYSGANSNDQGNSSQRGP